MYNGKDSSTGPPTRETSCDLEPISTNISHATTMTVDVIGPYLDLTSLIWPCQINEQHRLSPSNFLPVIAIFVGALEYDGVRANMHVTAPEFCLDSIMSK